MRIKVRISTNVTGYTTVTVTVAKDGITAVKSRKAARSELAKTIIELRSDALEFIGIAERALA